MKDEWVEPYEHNIGLGYIRLPGSNSCTHSLVVALGFAIPQ